MVSSVVVAPSLTVQGIMKTGVAGGRKRDKGREAGRIVENAKNTEKKKRRTRKTPKVRKSTRPVTSGLIVLWDAEFVDSQLLWFFPRLYPLESVTSTVGCVSNVWNVFLTREDRDPR